MVDGAMNNPTDEMIHLSKDKINRVQPYVDGVASECVTKNERISLATALIVMGLHRLHKEVSREHIQKLVSGSLDTLDNVEKLQ